LPKKYGWLKSKKFGIDLMIDLGRIAKQLRHRPIRATGGDITDVTLNGKRYKVHTFLTSGQFSVQDGGEFEYLVVAGGGRGGNSTGAPFGGGGGAGGLRIGKLTINSGSQATVVVGGPGENSSFGTIVSNRGGAGGNGTAGSQTLRNGQSGGSGGGGGGGDSVTPGLAGAGNTPATTPSQGNSGGRSTGGINFAGGGGGAGGAGEITTQPRNSLPGIGLTTNFSGEVKTYAAGGPCGVATASIANTGDGGAGGFNGNDGLLGGSGIVVIRYRFRYSKD
jgi:hypothetical protein